MIAASVICSSAMQIGNVDRLSTHMSQDHEVVQEEDDLALEEVPQRLAALLLLLHGRLSAAAEPVGRVQLVRGECHTAAATGVTTS